MVSHDMVSHGMVSNDMVSRAMVSHVIVSRAMVSHDIPGMAWQAIVVASERLAMASTHGGARYGPASHRTFSKRKSD